MRGVTGHDKHHSMEVPSLLHRALPSVCRARFLCGGHAHPSRGLTQAWAALGRWRRGTRLFLFFKKGARQAAHCRPCFFKKGKRHHDRRNFLNRGPAL